MITNFSVGGFCNKKHDAVSELIITYIAQQGRRYYLSIKSHPRLSASNSVTLGSSIRIVSPQPSRASAACHTADTLDDMADTRCCHCCVPASRPAQKQRRWKWRARQKWNDKDSQENFYTCQRQSISQHDVKITSPKKLRTRPLEGAAAPYRPPWLRHWYRYSRRLPALFEFLHVDIRGTGHTLSRPWSRQPNDVMSEIVCAQLHNELLWRRMVSLR